MDLGLITLIVCSVLGGFIGGYVLCAAISIKHFQTHIDRLGRCIYIGNTLYFAKRISK